MGSPWPAEVNRVYDSKKGLSFAFQAEELLEVRALLAEFKEVILETKPFNRRVEIDASLCYGVRPPRSAGVQ